MSTNEKSNGGFHSLKVSKFEHSSTTPRAQRWQEWVLGSLGHIGRLGVGREREREREERERESCLLVLNSVTCTPQGTSVEAA